MENLNKRFKALTLTALLIFALSFTAVPNGPEDPDPMPMVVEGQISTEHSEGN